MDQKNLIFSFHLTDLAFDVYDFCKFAFVLLKCKSGVFLNYMNGLYISFMAASSTATNSYLVIT